MATISFTIIGYKFDVHFEWNEALTDYPVQFIYYNGRRVGLFDVNDDHNTIYFNTPTMIELFGPEFNADNFSIGITFGLFRSDGMTNKQIYAKKNELDAMIQGAADVFQLYS